MGPEWVKRQGASHLFGIEAVTRSSFLGIEGDQTLSTTLSSALVNQLTIYLITPPT